MNKIHFRASTIPLALFFLCFLVFGPLIPFVGIYWDDWPSLWFLHFFGPTIFPTVFAADRPVQGWLWIITTTLAGESIISWQIFGVLTRLASGLALAWMLRALWPRHTFQITTVIVLFLIYPGFTQQYLPLTYVHMLMVQANYFLSVGAMLRAYQRPQTGWGLLAFSLISSFLGMFTLEYYVGLELLRPVLLWMIAPPEASRPTRRFRWAMQRWAPFIVTLAAFLAFRITHKTPRANIIVFDSLNAGPLATLLDLVKTALSDIYEGSVIAWGKAFSFPALFSQNRMLEIISIIVTAGVAMLVIVYLARLQTPEQASKQAGPGSETGPAYQLRWALQAIGVGIIALLVCGWPWWVTDLRIDLTFPWNRFTQAMMPGVSLVVAGLVSLVTRRQWQTALMVGLLAGVAAGYHFWMGVTYRQDWTLQRDFFWQLAWRVPGLQPNTTLLTPRINFVYNTDNSLTAPINWMYAPQQSSRQMDYALVDIDARLGITLPGLEAGLPIQAPFRATSFSGSTSQALVFYYDPPRCLKVFDPQRDQLWPYRPKYLDEAILLSRPELIQAQADPPARPPAIYFPEEPPHTWCYYFQKAELARQIGDWQEIVRLGDQALNPGPAFTQETIAELFPFIEGYAHAGKWERALQLTQQAYHIREKLQPALCQIWHSIQNSSAPSTEKDAAISQIRAKLKCELP